MTQSGGAIGDYSGQGWALKQGPLPDCKCGHPRRPHLPEIPLPDGSNPCLVLGCTCSAYDAAETKD